MIWKILERRKGAKSNKNQTWEDGPVIKAAIWADKLQRLCHGHDSD